MSNKESNQNFDFPYKANKTKSQKAAKKAIIP